MRIIKSSEFPTTEGNIIWIPPELCQATALEQIWQDDLVTIDEAGARRCLKTEKPLWAAVNNALKGDTVTLGKF